MARGGARVPSGRRWPSRLQLRQAWAPLTHVTPAKAGVHSDSVWIPAFAGMTRIGKPVQRPYTPPMERLDGGPAVPAHLRGGISALGNFAGFHRGHQAVVRAAGERARADAPPC